MTPEECTEHCRRFLVELDALCERYQVYLTDAASSNRAVLSVAYLGAQRGSGRCPGEGRCDRQGG